MTTPSAIPRPTRARLGVTSHRRRLLLLLCASTAVLAASPLGAQAPPASFRYIEEKCVPQPSPNPCSTNPRPPTADSPAFCDTNLFVCNILPNCVRPTVEGPYLEVVFEATGDRTARYVFDVIAPWNNFASAGGLGCNPNGTHDVVWRSTPFPSNYCPAGQETLLEPTQWDHYETWVRGSTLSCSMSAPAIDGPWYVLVKVCQQPCCTALCPPFCSTACICGFQRFRPSRRPSPGRRPSRGAREAVPIPTLSPVTKSTSSCAPAAAGINVAETSAARRREFAMRTSFEGFRVVIQVRVDAIEAAANGPAQSPDLFFLPDEL